MFKLINTTISNNNQKSKIGDTNYDIVLESNAITVSIFMMQMLNEYPNHWGWLSVYDTNKKCLGGIEFKGGKIIANNLSSEFLNRRIYNASAKGNKFGKMNYDIVIVPEESKAEDNKTVLIKASVNLRLEIPVTKQGDYLHILHEAKLKMTKLLEHNLLSQYDFNYEYQLGDDIYHTKLRRIKIMKVLFTAVMDVESEKAKYLKKLEQHPDYLLDLNTNPEIKSVYGVHITLEDELSKVVTDEKEFVSTTFPDKNNTIIKKSLAEPTVGDMIALLSSLPRNMKFCMSGVENYNLYINKDKNYCSVDENDYVFDAK